MLAGLLVGWVAIFGLETTVNHALYPPPADLDFTNKEAITDFMNSLPTQAFVLLLVTWMFGTFIGGLVGGWVYKPNFKNTAIIIGLVIAIGSIINMTMIPHPTWLMIVASIGYIPFAYAGGRLIAIKK